MVFCTLRSWLKNQNVSNTIAEIYSDAGKKGNTGLIKNNFIKTSAFEELLKENSTVIEKMKLYNHTNYLVLGKIRFSFKKGQLLKGTYICNALLNINLISTKYKISKYFEVVGKGNGVSNSQAKEYAINNLIQNYKEEISLIK